MEINSDSESSFELNQPQSGSRHEEFEQKREMFSHMFAQSAKQCAAEFANQFDKELAACHSEILAEQAQNQMLK